MELRRYWQVLRRYWWVIAVLTVIGLIAGVDSFRTSNDKYQAIMQVNIQRATNATSATDKDFFGFDGYYANLSSEYAADDFTMVVRGSRFLDDVSAALANTPYAMDSIDIRKAFELERKHREITFTIRSDSEARTLAIAKTFGQVLTQKGNSYLANPQNTPPLAVQVLDMPTQAQSLTGRNLLNAVIRVIIGLAVGIGLAFLLAYLDNRVRTPQEIKELLNLPVVGTIPAPTGRKTATPGLPSAPTGVDDASRERVEVR